MLTKTQVEDLYAGKLGTSFRNLVTKDMNISAWLAHPMAKKIAKVGGLIDVDLGENGYTVVLALSSLQIGVLENYLAYYESEDGSSFFEDEELDEDSYADVLTGVLDNLRLKE